jgi:hypothetical protein
MSYNEKIDSIRKNLPDNFFSVKRIEYTFKQKQDKISVTGLFEREDGTKDSIERMFCRDDFNCYFIPLILIAMGVDDIKRALLYVNGAMSNHYKRILVDNSVDFITIKGISILYDGTVAID